MKIKSLNFFFSLCVLCPGLQSVSAAPVDSTDQCAESRDDGDPGSPRLLASAACNVYRKFMEYLKASKSGENTLSFFSSSFKDEELSDLLASSDVSVVHNRIASKSLFVFGSHIVNIVDHQTSCSSSRCKLTVLFSSDVDNRQRNLSIDYVLDESGLPLIDRITINVGRIPDDKSVTAEKRSGVEREE